MTSSSGVSPCFVNCGQPACQKLGCIRVYNAEHAHDDLCTGASASWCPVHGDCTCQRNNEGELFDDLNDPHCPLHSWNSPHQLKDE